uniref:TOD1/MUCI70 glycosyltransferase-like domain-containing protein n=1 Tax=viral metagenome TaxID=1070528 RepID=A0A6C0BLK4_9ZZZZ
MSQHLCFYTVFYGSDGNWANLIPQVPSTTDDCYYLTNNLTTYQELAKTIGDGGSGDWKPIWIDQIPIYDTNQDAMNAKLYKACPHRHPILNQYEYSCYLDTKHNVDGAKVRQLVDQLADTMCMLLPRHPCNYHSVWNEYQLCLQYPKYAAEQVQYKTYLDQCLAQGYDERLTNHYTTQVIIRKNCPLTHMICETWYSNIQRCGIECQISFSIVQQRYWPWIQTMDYQACYTYCY